MNVIEKYLPTLDSTGNSAIDKVKARLCVDGRAQNRADYLITEIEAPTANIASIFTIAQIAVVGNRHVIVAQIVEVGSPYVTHHDVTVPHHCDLCNCEYGCNVSSRCLDLSDEVVSPVLGSPVPVHAQSCFVNCAVAGFVQRREILLNHVHVRPQHLTPLLLLPTPTSNINIKFSTSRTFFADLNVPRFQ